MDGDVQSLIARGVIMEELDKRQLIYLVICQIARSK